MLVRYHAVFLGKKSASPYKPRHAYNIEVKHHLFGRISVRPMHGYAYKPMASIRHTYINIASFLREWQIKGHIDPETGDIEPA